MAGGFSTRARLAGASAQAGGATEMAYMSQHGSFQGHVLPGVMFVAWGAWGLLMSARRHALLAGRQAGGRHGLSANTLADDELHARGRTWHALPASRLCGFAGSAPSSARTWQLYLASRIEPILKVVLPTVGILGELYINTGHWHSMLDSESNINSENLNNWQHALMYAAFALAGVLELLEDALLSSGKRVVPPGACAGATALAFFAEGVLFAFHLKGSAVEILTHEILVLAVALCVAGGVFELWATPESSAASPLASMCRHAAVLLQGCWFLQAAFILFDNDIAGARWRDNHVTAMALPPVFAFWLLVVHIFALATFAITAALTTGMGFVPMQNVLHQREPVDAMEEGAPAEADVHTIDSPAGDPWDKRHHTLQHRG